MKGCSQINLKSSKKKKPSIIKNYPPAKSPMSTDKDNSTFQNKNISTDIKCLAIYNVT